MSESTKLLNEVKNYLVKAASEKGIVLSEEFESPQAFKNYVIASTIKQLRELGLTTQQAYDRALGDGAYDNLYESVKHSLGAKQ